MNLAELTRKYHDLQDRGCEAFTEYESARTTFENAKPGDDRDALALKARNHLHRASALLRASLIGRQVAYHHCQVDLGHQKWEEKVQRWIDGNRDLDFELVDLGLDYDLQQQHTQLWNQFKERLKALKAAKEQKEKEKAEAENGLFTRPIAVNEPPRTGVPGQFHRVEWQTVPEPAGGILDTQKPRQGILFTLPTLPRREERSARGLPEGFGDYDDNIYAPATAAKWGSLEEFDRAELGIGEEEDKREGEGS